MCLQQTFEGEQWLVVKANALEIGGADPGFLKAVSGGQHGETGIMLAARKSLFLRRRDNTAIGEQAGGRVVIIG